jgi:predicted SnoaL-like aldol condensation-catalyzing enzyme
MSVEDNKTLVRTFVQQLINEHNFTGGERFLTETFTSHRPQRTTTGRDKWLAHFQQLVQEKVPNLRLEITRIIAEGDWVWTYAVVSGGMQVKPGFKRESVDMYHLKDGKIDEHWDVQQDVPEGDAQSA